MFPVKKVSYDMKKRKTEKYFIKKINTERYMKSAIPAMKRVLNREEMKRRNLLNVSLASENNVFVTVSQRKYNLLLLLSHKVEVEVVLQ